LARSSTSPSARDAPSLIGTFVALIRVMSARRRRHLLVATAAMGAGAVAELVTIGAVLPFLALVSDPARAAPPPC
jgi:hypothetical protein